MSKGLWAIKSHSTDVTYTQTQNPTQVSMTAMCFATTTSKSSNQPTNPEEWLTEFSNRWVMSDWLLKYRDSGTGLGQDKSKDNNSNILKQHSGMPMQNIQPLATTSHEQEVPPELALASSPFHHSMTYHPSLAPHDLPHCSLFPHSRLHKDLVQGPIHLRHTRSTLSRMKTVISKSITTALSAWNLATTLTATAATAANGALKHTLLVTAQNPTPSVTPRTAMSQFLTPTMANTALNTSTTPLSFYSTPLPPPHWTTHTFLTSQM
jgi:hypothetical protein